MKNFNKYYNILLKYCETCRIKVYTRSNFNNAFYSPKKRMIVFDDKQPPKRVLAWFIHELGHFEDDLVLDGIDEFYATIASKIDNAELLYKKEVEFFYKIEERAWDSGRLLAEKKLLIPCGKWFDKEKKVALDNYLKEMKVFKSFTF